MFAVCTARGVLYLLARPPPQSQAENIKAKEVTRLCGRVLPWPLVQAWGRAGAALGLWNPPCAGSTLAASTLGFIYHERRLDCQHLSPKGRSMAISEVTRQELYRRAGGHCECTMSRCSHHRAGARCPTPWPLAVGKLITEQLVVRTR